MAISCHVRQYQATGSDINDRDNARKKSGGEGGKEIKNKEEWKTCHFQIGKFPLRKARFESVEAEESKNSK